MLRDMLKLEGIEVGRKHVGTRMKKTGIEAIYRKAHTSRRNQARRIYPYLLRDLTIDRPNQVWAMDATCIPMRRGFVYPERRARLGHPSGAGLAPVEQSGGRSLRRCPGRSHSEIRLSERRVCVLKLVASSALRYESTLLNLSYYKLASASLHA